MLQRCDEALHEHLTVTLGLDPQTYDTRSRHHKHKRDPITHTTTGIFGRLSAVSCAKSCARKNGHSW